MAWEVLTSVLKELNFEYNGTVQKISPVVPALLVFPNDAVTMCANPYSSSSISHSASSGTANYAAIAAQVAGSLNLCVLGSVMANNTTAYIYRNNRNIRLELKRQNQLTGNIRYTLYGYAYGSRVEFFSDEERDHRTYASNKIGLIFLQDKDNGKYQIWDQLSFTIPNYTAYLYLTCGGSGDGLVKNVVLNNLITGNEYTPPASDEPYGDDTYSTSKGGDGDHDDTSDTISQDAIPIAAATRSGMCTAWVPNWGEIQDVADALLDPNIFQILAGNVVKFSDVIIGLSIFPCTIPATDTDTVKANVLGIEIGTGVQAHIANDQFVEINCGTLDVKEYWGNCLDYNPYTRISIFLPFCGMYELDVDEVMGKTIGVSYRIDIMSGSCLATIKINDSVFYQYPGQCSAQVPLSSVSFDQFLGSMIELGVATATGVGAVGAAGGAVSAVKDQMFVPQSRADLRSHTEEIASAEQNYSKVKEQSANSIADAAVGAVMGSKGFYQHAGAMSGSPGFLGIKTPYLIIKRPEQLIPGMYGKFHGFPSNTTAVLGDLVGYTEVGDIRLNIPEATVDEIIECEQLLKGGVVI